MKEFKREVYLIICTKGNGSIKVITCIRRCSKYYLLSEVVKEDHIVKLVFDKFENKKYRAPDKFT